MPVPGVSPLALVDAICPICSGVLEKKVVANTNGSFSHVLYGCVKCQYAFHHRPDHLRGDFVGFNVFLETSDSKVKPQPL